MDEQEKTLKTIKTLIFLTLSIIIFICCISSRRGLFCRNDRVSAAVSRFRFPLNPNPVISSSRYTGIGNGIAHSNGHRFPPTAAMTVAGGRSR